MDRDIDQFERQDEHGRSDFRAAGREQDSRGHREVSALNRERQAVESRGRTYRISEVETETLHEIGQFRTVATDDLARHRYGGNAGQMKQDLYSLARQGLVQRRSVYDGKMRLAVVVLTRAGKDWLDQKDRDQSKEASEKQRVYAGFVKPAEVFHDAAIYRMFHAEAGAIEKEGGKVRRVVLDYELKQKVYSPLAKNRGLGPLEYTRRQREVASANGLQVINGHIPLPDLRIEYETREGEMTKVDLELATHHYHGSHLEPKAEAGFKMYAADGSASRLTASLKEREITASILSL